MYFRNRDDCWRCGQPGHKTFKYFSFNMLQGTALLEAPWRAAGASEGKRKRDEEVEEHPCDTGVVSNRSAVGIKGNQATFQ